MIDKEEVNRKNLKEKVKSVGHFNLTGSGIENLSETREEKGKEYEGEDPPEYTRVPKFVVVVRYLEDKYRD